MNYQEGWNEAMSLEDTKNLAYWERNMLALLLAKLVGGESGWYFHGEYEGWSRVISLYGGKVTFHVPDDFDLSSLKEIEKNWDGHTTFDKWENVKRLLRASPLEIEDVLIHGWFPRK